MRSNRLIPTPHYFPLHLHIVRSLLALIQHTQTYVPLAPYLLAILTSATSISKPKSSTLKPLDFELTIRAQTQYLKTRIYMELLVEETCYLLAEWGAFSQSSVAFPEIVVPVIVALKRTIKESKAAKGGAAKAVGGIKTLVERFEEGARWVKERRAKGTFSPADRSEVDRWQRGIKVSETPVGKYATVLRKARENRRALLEKAREGKGEYVDE
jgi:nucleolar complex protein 2